MSKQSLLFTFPDEATCSEFIDILYGTGVRQVTQALSTMTRNPALITNEQKLCALFVGNKKIVEGQYPELNKRFEQEVGSHSASVALREFRNGEWVVVRKRLRPQTS